MKKVFKYISIALLLFLGLIFGCVLYLFFVRGSAIFGITYISYNEQKNTISYPSNVIDNIELNTGSFAVDIVNTSSKDLYCNLKVKMFGFTKVDSSRYNVDSEYEQDSKTLRITITEPHGFAVNSGSKITLYVPNNLSFVKSLAINNSNSSVQSNLIKTTIGNLDYKTNSGKLSLNTGKGFYSMNLDIGKGSVVLSKDLTIENIKTSLSITSGLFDASEVELGTVKLINNQRGIIRIGKCVSFISDNEGDYGGTISINETTQIKYYAADTILNLDKINNPTDPTALDIILTKSGSVNINELNTPGQIETNSGKITIASAHTTISKAASKSGNIIITNADQTVRCKSESGNVRVTFSDTVINMISNPNGKTLIVDDIKSGSLSVSGVNHFEINSSGKGKIDVDANLLYGSNRISGASGNVNVKFDHDSVAVISASSSSGTTRINTSSVPEYNGTINTANKVYVNCNEAEEPIANSLLVTTISGNITIISDNLE